ncbi:MAG: CCA tRNA nucleotidyltransferase [Oligoflexales bacterium]|nr:CCA tRNA nucleotidyltransferase [Oligoflexales bacterium]
MSKKRTEERSAEEKAEKKYRDSIWIIEKLEQSGFSARLVGGCVRDRLLNLEPKDFDVATSAKPDEILAVFAKSELKLLTMGKEHGTITIVMPSHPIEVTTLREDAQTFGRKAEVAFHTDFKTDAARRDFTINALSEDKDGAIFDYFEGRKHLQEKRICFVGEARGRIEEDFLRILRFFRFKARYKLSSDQDTLNALKELRHGLAMISAERITHEFFGILACTDIDQTLQEMSEALIYEALFPEFQHWASEEKIACFQFISQLSLSKVSSDLLPLARLSAMYWVVYKKDRKESGPRELSLSEVLPRLKLSRQQEVILEKIVSFWGQMEKVQHKLGEALHFIDLIEERSGEAQFHNFYSPIWLNFMQSVFFKENQIKSDTLAYLMRSESQFGWRRKVKIPVDGSFLIKNFHLKPGEELGRQLFQLKLSFYEGKWTKREEIFHLLQSDAKLFNDVKHEIP